MAPQTRYARSGDLNIAYQATGKGPRDLLFALGWVSNVELMWEEPSLARFLHRLASFSRLILFDKRGTGLSDRVAAPATLEQRMDDIRAVLDAAGSERAALFGASEGASMCVLFAATHPDRTTALVTFGTFAKRVWSPDDPWAPTPEERQEFYDAIETGWDSTPDLGTISPSVANDPAFARWFTMYRRHSASPGAALALARMNTAIDIRDVLPAVRVPTLVLHRTGDRDARVEEGRYIASRISGATFVELAGEDHLPFVADQDSVLDEIEEFLTGVRPPPASDRVLATVLFTDIARSTALAAELGDRRWRDVLERHHGAVRALLARYRGQEIDTAGDGFFAAFDGPARAVQCACAVRDAARALGLEIRAGLHTGECERMAGKIGGLAVNVAARIRELASPGEVLVSSTVRDLVSGSGIRFADRGAHALKGVPDERRLFAVEPA